MAAETRIYEVRNTDMLESHPPRLIEAQNQAHALRHISKAFEVSVPNAKRVYELTTVKGIKVEVA